MATVHVLHVINQFSPWGGAEVSLREIIRGTAGEFRHTVVSLDPINDSDRADEADAAFVSPPTALRGRWTATRFVTRAIRANRPDLVHTTLFDADLAGRVAAYRTGTPVVSSLVNTPYDPQARATEPTSAAKLAAVRAVDGLLARHATTAFHAISQTTADHAMRHLHVCADAIRVVPRGRDLRLLGVGSPERRHRVRTALGWGDRPVIINVARQEPQKGHVLLVEVMQRVLRQHPDALLVLVGREGRATAAFRERATSAGVDSSIVSLGVRADVPDLLAAADVFAFPSRYEGLGGATVEAIGLGVPVVCHDIPALREVVGDDHPWLAPLGDAATFADHILAVLSGGPAVREVSAAELARFAQRFELSRCVDGMAQLYHDVLAATRAHGRRRVPVAIRPAPVRSGDA